MLARMYHCRELVPIFPPAKNKKPTRCSAWRQRILGQTALDPPTPGVLTSIKQPPVDQQGQREFDFHETNLPPCYCTHCVCVCVQVCEHVYANPISCRISPELHPLFRISSFLALLTPPTEAIHLHTPPPPPPSLRLISHHILLSRSGPN